MADSTLIAGLAGIFATAATAAYANFTLLRLERERHKAERLLEEDRRDAAEQDEAVIAVRLVMEEMAWNSNTLRKCVRDGRWWFKFEAPTMEVWHESRAAIARAARREGVWENLTAAYYAIRVILALRADLEVAFVDSDDPLGFDLGWDATAARIAQDALDAIERARKLDGKRDPV